MRYLITCKVYRRIGNRANFFGCNILEIENLQKIIALLVKVLRMVDRE